MDWHVVDVRESAMVGEAYSLWPLAFSKYWVRLVWTV
jgi:hypothetical protein